jgi:malonyl-ACP decarboxylase
MARAVLANWLTGFMPSPYADSPRLAVTGIGAACGAGFGKEALHEALFSAPDLFTFLQRPGRQSPTDTSRFIGIEIPTPPTILSPRVERTVGFTSRVAVAVLDEAWREARLDDVDPERIGLVVGGSSLNSREQSLAAESHAGRPAFIPPRHGHIFSDSELGGVCTSTFPIRGFSHTVGAASASGAVATLQAMEAVHSGRVDVCIALGALQDLSLFDLQGLRALGAMGSSRFADSPLEACRPMSQDHDGFIYGEACAALVIERRKPDQDHYGVLLGGAQITDGSRGPEPNTAGQQRAAQMALTQAGLQVKDIDYVNGHATGTPLGDCIELETYKELGLQQAWINTTKSLLGHGLSAAGAIEIAAVFLQMRQGLLHPCRNLEPALDTSMRWVGATPQPHRIRHALKLSFGFGGVNTALILKAP